MRQLTDILHRPNTTSTNLRMKRTIDQQCKILPRPPGSISRYKITTWETISLSYRLNHQAIATAIEANFIRVPQLSLLEDKTIPQIWIRNLSNSGFTIFPQWLRWSPCVTECDPTKPLNLDCAWAFIILLLCAAVMSCDYTPSPPTITSISYL